MAVVNLHPQSAHSASEVYAEPRCSVLLLIITTGELYGEVVSWIIWYTTFLLLGPRWSGSSCLNTHIFLASPNGWLPSFTWISCLDTDEVPRGALENRLRWRCSISRSRVGCHLMFAGWPSLSPLPQALHSLLTKVSLHTVIETWVIHLLMFTAWHHSVYLLKKATADDYLPAQLCAAISFKAAELVLEVFDTKIISKILSHI